MEQENQCLNTTPSETEKSSQISTTKNNNDTQKMKVTEKTIKINNYVKLRNLSEDGQNSDHIGGQFVNEEEQKEELQINESSCRLLDELEAAQDNNNYVGESSEEKNGGAENKEENLKAQSDQKRFKFFERIARSLSRRNNKHRVKVQQYAQQIYAQQEQARKRFNDQQIQSKSKRGYTSFSGQNL
eukprot:TRINITY_DN15982_c0_g6_i1.p2 TRINITY_DN15982_c0_g6~~TRINITY_DN15982_c0_g6_i1.p2  ORF type:complete len:186 (-),score=36.58 TRINITY_DN15982_c0_g6_i1:331-888(-)